MNIDQAVQTMNTEQARSLDSLLANPKSIATFPLKTAQQFLISLVTIQPILMQRALAVRSVGNEFITSITFYWEREHIIVWITVLQYGREYGEIPTAYRRTASVNDGARMGEKGDVGDACDALT